MKFVYEYKTSDNERREGQLSAASRDAAYAELKRRGIRPSKVVLAPGLLNRISSFGKRGLAIVVLAVLCLVLAIAVGRGVLTAPQASALDTVLDSPIRRQPIGDAAVIEQGIRTGWADVFELEGDRFLASFAIPGTAPAIRSTTEEKLKEALHSTPTSPTYTSGSVSLESRQIRAMVEGMKNELREFLADGGTVVEYGKELVRRQEQELGYYNRAKSEIEAAHESGMNPAQLTDLWNKRNASLRRMGIRLVSLPE